LAFSDQLFNLIGNYARTLSGQFGDLSAYDLGGANAVQQAHEDGRAHQELLQQLALHNNVTPYEAAQIQQMGDAAQRQQGEDVMRALQGGFTRTPQGGSPDVTIGGQGFTAPADITAQTYAIKADSELGKYLGVPQDITGLTAPQYIQASQGYASKKLAETDKQNAQAQLDIQKATAKKALAVRFSQPYYESIYGKGVTDPTAGFEAQNLSNEIDSIKGQPGMAAFQQKLSGYKTNWESMQMKRMELQAQLAAKAQYAQVNGDPHLFQAITSQNHALDQLEAPLQKEFTDGSNVISMLSARNPAADAQAIVSLQPYLTGLKRFSDTELNSIRNGATGWQQIQRSANKWATDPNHVQIPEEQRQQMLQLVRAKQASLKTNLDAINDTRDDFTDASTAADVLKSSAKLHRKLSAGAATQQQNGVVTDLIRQYGGGR
jgi:hypothetical protein